MIVNNVNLSDYMPYLMILNLSITALNLHRQQLKRLRTTVNIKLLAL